MSYFQKADVVQVEPYVYDATEDATAVGEVFLSSKAGKDPLPVGAIVQQCVAKVVTAVTSSGSATMIWGNDDDPDGYSGSAIGKANLTANAIFNGWDSGAALLWDDTNDHPIYFHVADEDDGEVSVTIGGEALDTGKVALFLHFLYPNL